MEQVIEKERSLTKSLLSALLILGTVFSLVVIVYGLDAAVPGVHDAFHDFRHVIGMPCH